MKSVSSRIDGSETRRDARHPHGEEAYRVGDQQREGGTAQQQAGRHSEEAAAQTIHPVIGQRERQQYADRDHGARDGIAQRGELDQAIERAPAHQAKRRG